MKLSKNYKVCEDLFKGDFPANPRLLFVKNPGSELSKDYLLKVAQESATSVLSSPESLIKTLAQEEKTTQEISKEEKDFVKEYVENSVPKPDQRLIEEIGDLPQFHWVSGFQSRGKSPPGGNMRFFGKVNQNQNYNVVLYYKRSVQKKCSTWNTSRIKKTG